MSSTARHSSRLRKAAIAFGAGALLVGLSACGSSGSGGGSGLADAGAEGIDDGTTLTLWTRAPLEKQANLLVDAYNAMKLRHRDSPEEYEQRKSAFFDMLMDPR